MKKLCINCRYFLNCEDACESLLHCEKFEKAKREVKGVPITDNATGEVVDYFDYINNH